MPLYDFGPRPAGYHPTIDVPEIEALGPEQAVTPLPIDAGLLDSRE